VVAETLSIVDRAVNELAAFLRTKGPLVPGTVEQILAERSAADLGDDSYLRRESWERHAAPMLFLAAECTLSEDSEAP
jgi:hypothetical protein